MAEEKQLWPPTTGVEGSVPRFKSAREELPELNREYLIRRNAKLQAQAFMAETQSRGEARRAYFAQARKVAGGVFANRITAESVGVPVGSPSAPGRQDSARDRADFKRGMQRDLPGSGGVAGEDDGSEMDGED